MRTEGKIARAAFFVGLFTAYIFALFGILVCILDPKFYQVLLG